MDARAPRHHHSFDEYLLVEEMSSVRHEYFAGEIYAMAGGTPEHSALGAAIIVALGTELLGRPCRVHTSDLRLRVRATGLATYADVAVVCDPVERDPDSPTHVTNPCVIVEVLSPSTEDYDLGDKREHYQQMESLEIYLCVRQDRRHVECWLRDGEDWLHLVCSSGDVVRLDAIGCALAIDAVYDAAGVA
jgi:Uma2 family endonuclease